MRRAALIACASLVDIVVGDPQAIPHPVSIFAAAARALEPIARRRFRNEIAGGGALAIAIAGGALAAGRALSRTPAPVRIAIAASTLAAGSLLDHATAVNDALARNDLPAARKAVARMVGRDTEHLDESGIARAAIESLAESLCDGVVAPLLALAIGGLPAALAYKAINTLDSLIGHIEPPYTRFGRVAARLDDVANFVPARLSASLIALASAVCGANGWRSLRIARRDGRHHRSPNAGLSEAAIAGALGVQLGGPLQYDRIPYAAPLIGAEFRKPRASDVGEATLAIFVASWLASAFAIAVAAVRR